MNRPASTEQMFRREFISWTTWLLVGVPSVLGSVALLTATGMPRVDAAVLGLQAWLALGAVWLCSRGILALVTRPRWESLGVAVAFALGAGMRAYVEATALDSWLFAPVAIVYIFLLSLLFATVVESTRSHLNIMRRLRDIHATLEAVSDRVDIETRVLQRSMQEAVLSALEMALRSAKDRREVSIQMKRVTQDVVRPMSHDLAHTEPDTVNVALRVAGGFDMRSVVRAALSSNPCHPVLLPTVFVLSILPPLTAIFGLGQVLLVTLVMWTITAALLGAFSRLPWARMPVILGAVLLPMSILAAGVMALLALQSVAQPAMSFETRGIYGLVFLVFLGVVMALLVGLRKEQPRIRERLIEANMHLAETASLASGRLRRERRNLAKIFHGVVQPRLIARAIEESDAKGAVDVDALLTDLTEVLSRAVEQESSVDLRGVLNDLQEVWTHTTRIEITVSESVDRAVSADHLVGRALCEVACEAVNNAVVRADAPWVSLDAWVHERRIHLRVRNPSPSAPGVGVDSRKGLGTDLYQSMTDRWELTEVDGEIVFSAEFISLRDIYAERTFRR